MSAAILTMSQQEFERAALMRKIHERRLTQAKAAELLGLNVRQVERLHLSRETLRRWMTEDGLWVPHVRRRERADQPRRRRDFTATGPESSVSTPSSHVAETA
jgi:hypothetical protein